MSDTEHNRCRRCLRRLPGLIGMGKDPWSHDLKGLLSPYHAGVMTYSPVSTRVGNVKNNDADLIEEVALP